MARKQTGQDRPGKGSPDQRKVTKSYFNSSSSPECAQSFKAQPIDAGEGPPCPVGLTP